MSMGGHYDQQVTEAMLRDADKALAKELWKRTKSASRTQYILQTCPVLSVAIIGRQGAVDQEKRKMELKCEAAPAAGTVAVPGISGYDVGRQVIFSAFGKPENVVHFYGVLESLNFRTIHPRDGSPAWKARIFLVRADDTDQLCGVRETRILSIH